MVVLSIVYGVLVAIFAVMSVDFLGSFAAVGAIVVGGLLGRHRADVGDQAAGADDVPT